MDATPTPEPQQLLSLATAIAGGAAVDWDRTDPTTTPPEVLEALKAIDQLAVAAHRIPDAWGRASISGELGQGSYGTVYAAHDAALGVDIALKVVRPQGVDREARIAAALNEAKLLAQLNHPNVVRIFWAENVGAEVGVAMERVQGQTLAGLLEERGSLTADEAAAIGADVCSALHAAHAANLLHGDVKAGNVMRTGDGRTVLMDFGVGQDLKSGGSPGLRRLGTPLYQAPELFHGGERSRQSDIYSVGVLLFHLMTGGYPIDAREAADVDRHHAARLPLRRLRDVRPDLPAPFVRVVERALAERPEARYSTAAELGAALQDARRAPRRPHWLWPAALAASTAVVALGVYLQRSMPADSTPAAGPTVAATVPAPAPAATPVDAYQIDVAVYRHENGADLRLTSGARVSPGDELSLRLTASVPVYAYVVNEDDRGASFLLFPLPEQRLTNPLPPGTRHELPGVVSGEAVRWTVSSAGGREHFLVFVSPQPPSPAFERMFAALPRPTRGAPIVAQPLSPDQIVELRGVGGLKPATPAAISRRLADEFAVPLPDAVETARGVWVRQLTLQNPGR